jgi:hypothetical protein
VRATAWFFKGAAVTVPLVAAWGLVGQAQTMSDRKGERACLALAKEMGAEGNLLSRKRYQNWTLLSWKEATCWYDEKGRVRMASLSDLNFSWGRFGKPKISRPDQVVALMNSAFKRLGFKYQPPLSTSPSFTSGQIAAVLSAPAEAYGKPAWGALGGYIVSIDLRTGRIRQLDWCPELSPARPVVKINQSEALKIALRELAGCQDPKARYSIAADLRYYWPFPRNQIPGSMRYVFPSTPSGEKYFSKGKVPYCWAVAQRPVDSQGRDRLKQFFGQSSIVIDASNGDVLMVWL